jgi:hypothetical protein
VRQQSSVTYTFSLSHLSSSPRSTHHQVWAYLSLVCLQTNRRLEAEQTFKFAVGLGLQQDSDVFALLRKEQQARGFGNPFLA